MADLIFYLGDAFLILLGVAIMKVGVQGERLGAFKLVSHVQRYPGPPRRHHRYVTVGIGILSVLVGLAFLIFQFTILRRR
jgi:hypothetical protein